MTTYRELEQAVLREFGITREELIGPSRCRNLHYARMVLVSLVAKHTDLKLKQAGYHMNRHHSTLLASKRRCNEVVSVAIKYLSIQESKGWLE